MEPEHRVGKGLLLFVVVVVVVSVIKVHVGFTVLDFDYSACFVSRSDSGVMVGQGCKTQHFRKYLFIYLGNISNFQGDMRK